MFKYIADYPTAVYYYKLYPNCCICQANTMIPDDYLLVFSEAIRRCVITAIRPSEVIPAISAVKNGD
jgi:hypothetical protein